MIVTGMTAGRVYAGKAPPPCTSGSRILFVMHGTGPEGLFIGIIGKTGNRGFPRPIMPGSRCRTGTPGTQPGHHRDAVEQRTEEPTAGRRAAVGRVRIHPVHITRPAKGRCFATCRQGIQPGWGCRCKTAPPLITGSGTAATPARGRTIGGQHILDIPGLRTGRTAGSLGP